MTECRVGDESSTGGPSPATDAEHPARRRLAVRRELALALLPTATVLVGLWLVEEFTHQHLLFGALAASAFLIYADPTHEMNTIRALVFGHVFALVAGFTADWVLGSGYAAAAVAMVVTILFMVLLDVVHPPAIATSLSFAFRPATAGDAEHFLLALGMLVVLVLIQRAAQHLFWRLAA